MTDIVNIPNSASRDLRRRLAQCTTASGLQSCRDDYASLALLPEAERAEWANLFARAQLRVAVAEALG